MNILALGAHPDDIELGCGGLLLKAARSGHKIFMGVLTRGGASGDPVVRSEELIRSARTIGATKLWIDNFGDTKLQVDDALINHLEYFIHKADPDVILTHSIRDYHHDHRAVAECSIEAGRYSQNVLAYEMPVTKNFKPQVYYDISDVMQEKIELIQIFWSQQTKLFTKANSIRGLAEYRALQSRLNTSINAVEAFEIVKMCFSRDFTLLKMPQHSLPSAVLNGVDVNDIIEWEPTPKLKAGTLEDSATLTIHSRKEELNKSN